MTRGRRAGRPVPDQGLRRCPTTRPGGDQGHAGLHRRGHSRARRSSSSRPLKGPALEQITVAVGSGLNTAEEGAGLYDQDVEKQAQQLGLPGW